MVAPFRILLVEDDAALRRSICRILRLHADVTAVGDVAAALGHLDAEDVEAVVTDLDLGPNASGLEVLRHAAQRRPKAVRILSSGSTISVGVEEALADGTVQQFLAKPVDNHALLDALRHLTGHPLPTTEDLGRVDDRTSATPARKR